MVSSQHRQRVRVGEDPLVEGQAQSRLVDALEDRDRVPRLLLGGALETQRETLEELSVPAMPWRKLRGPCCTVS